MEILNCLMTNGEIAILVDITGMDEPQFYLETRNCTIDNFVSGVVVFPEIYGGIIDGYVNNNLFSNLEEEGISMWGEGEALLTIDYNAFYECKSWGIGFEFGEHNISLTSNPYKSSPNGSFYTAEWINLEDYSYDSQLVGQGESLLYYPEPLRDEITKRTIFRPFNLTNDTINNDSSGECASYNFRSSELVETFGDSICESGGPCEDDRVDIGYHYDVVHGSVSGTPSPTLTSRLKLDPGTVITYDSGAKMICDKQGNNTGYLIAEGLPEQMVLFTSIKATGDGITLPAAGDYESAIWLTDDANSPKIDFAVFEYATEGVKREGTLTSTPNLVTVKNSIFRRCQTGINSVYSHINLLNCLVVENLNGVKFYTKSSSQYYNANIEGCTFSGNNYAFLQDAIDTVPSKLLIEDNIFANQRSCVFKDLLDGEAEAVVRNNLFWNNETTGFLDITRTEDNNILGENPLFCHRSRAADGVTVLEPDPLTGKFNPNDGYYLVQRSGDASRRPLLLGDLDNTEGIGPLKAVVWVTGSGYVESEVGENNNTIIYKIEIRVSNGIPQSWASAPLLGYYKKGLGYYDGAETDSQPVIVILSTDTGFNFGTGLRAYYFYLKTANGSRIKVCLPGVNLNAWDKMVFWVAEDGSTYYTDLSHSTTFDSSKTVPDIFDMDSYFALRWDTSSTNGYQPAQSSSLYFTEWGCTYQQLSPAVDAGTIDLLNGGTTKTEIDDSSGVNKNIPDQPAKGYNGWDDVADLKTWASSEPIDLGYHYAGQTFWVSDEQKAQAIRFPKHGISEPVAEPTPWSYPSGNVNVEFWAKSDPTQAEGDYNIFVGYIGGYERVGAVFEARAIGNPEHIDSLTQEDKEKFYVDQDTLYLGFGIFRDETVGVMQDDNITNDDYYRSIELHPRSKFICGTYSPRSINWQVTSIAPVTIPYHHRADDIASTSTHYGEVYVGVTMNLGVLDGRANNSCDPGNPWQDFRGKYIASLLRIYRYEHPKWYLIAERIHNPFGIDFSNPVRPEDYPQAENSYITTDIRNLALTVHEDPSGDVSVYAFWLENTSSDPLNPHYALYGARIKNADSRKGDGTGDNAPLIIDNPKELDNPDPVTEGDLVVKDHIDVDWDCWVRNNMDSLPSGYTGVPRLVYTRIDPSDGKKKSWSVRISLEKETGSEGEIDEIHETYTLENSYGNVDYDCTKPFMRINRSKFHNPEENHAFAISEMTYGSFEYSLALSGIYYDYDVWSQPNKVISSPSGMVIRPVGSPRFSFPGEGRALTSSSEIDEKCSDNKPRIGVNMHTGHYGGGDYRDTWLVLRDVYACFTDSGGDPGPGWDMDGDGVIYEQDPDGNVYRDPDDLVTTIIFKQIDP